MLLPYINLLFSFCKDIKEVDSFILSYLPENLFNFLHFLFNYYFLVQKKSQPALRDLAKPSMN